MSRSFVYPTIYLSSSPIPYLNNSNQEKQGYLADTNPSADATSSLV